MNYKSNVLYHYGFVMYGFRRKLSVFVQASESKQTVINNTSLLLNLSIFCKSFTVRAQGIFIFILLRIKTAHYRTRYYISFTIEQHVLTPMQENNFLKLLEMSN
jgi:hypothetical protein